MTRSAVWTLGVLGALAAAPATVPAQLAAPKYESCRLDGIFPAGGRAGEAVTVEFQGYEGGLQFPRTIVIDGPPGVTVGEIKNLDVNRLTAVLHISADAVPGRRAVRVLNEQSGLTNLAWFSVGRLPERSEQEPNNERTAAEKVTLPVTINGRVNPETDVDSFQFSGRAGQRLVALVQAHALDVHGQYKKRGVVDASLEILDASGRVVAEAQDTLGLDPLLETTLPADGDYVAQVRLLNFDGFPQAVYRLTLGDVPVPVAAFPPGGPRGATVDVALRGWTAPLLARRTVVIEPGAYPWQPLTIGGELDSGFELPLLRGDGPESVEAEPNDQAAQATPLTLPVTVNGRFDAAGDADWYRLELADLAPIWLETTAHRFLRAPVDTLLQVYDAEGKLLQEMDDGVPDAGYESFHDFRTPDSRLIFTPKAAGVHFVRVAEMNAAAGPQAIYRLTARPALPDFQLILFPDAAPIWGPGSTSAVLVKLERQAGLVADIELAVEGLPTGWTGSRVVNVGRPPAVPSNYGQKHFLTITAPPDVAPGTAAEFRVVGRAAVDGRMLERVALPLSLFYTSDTGFFRASPAVRAAVTRPLAPALSTDVRDIAGRTGETLTIPVRVSPAADLKEIALTASLASNGVACSLDAPRTVPLADGVAQFPLTLPDHLPPGEYGFVVALSWRSDIRIGMPGPCTALIKLTVLPKS